MEYAYWKYGYRKNIWGVEKGVRQMSLAWVFDSFQVKCPCIVLGVLHVQNNVFNLHKTVSHTVYHCGKPKNNYALNEVFPSVPPSHQALCKSCIDGPSITDALPMWPIDGHKLSWLHNRLDTSETQKTKTFVPVLLLSSNCKKRDPTFRPRSQHLCLGLMLNRAWDREITWDRESVIWT